MTPIDYIRVDADILSLQICDKAKLLLGLIKRFNNKGLMMSNTELGKLLNCSGDNIKKLLGEIKDSIRIENRQSKYRKIFYSGINYPVKDGYSVKCAQVEASTGENKPPTGENATHIIERTKEEASSAFVEYWKSKGNMPEIRAFTDQRKTKLKARMAERLFADNWPQVIDKISTSRFCTGHNDRGWKVDVDWILKNSTNYTKVLEGKYDNNGDDIDFETTEEEAEVLMAEISK